MRDFIVTAGYIVLILAIVLVGAHVASGMGGDVVRASEPVTSHARPQPDSSCCIIPANRGLYKAGR